MAKRNREPSVKDRSKWYAIRRALPYLRKEIGLAKRAIYGSDNGNEGLLGADTFIDYLEDKGFRKEK